MAMLPIGILLSLRLIILIPTVAIAMDTPSFEENLKKKCDSLSKEKITGAQAACIGESAVPEIINNEISALESITLPTQQYVYLAHKSQLKKQEDLKKKEYLGLLKESFGQDEVDQKKQKNNEMIREGYEDAYRDLVETVHLLHQKNKKLEYCKFRPQSPHCERDKKKALTAEVQLIQARKISILANNPILSANSITKRIERTSSISYPLFKKEFERKNGFNHGLDTLGKKLAIPDEESVEYENYRILRMSEEMSFLPKLIRQSIDETNEVLDERISTWQEMIDGIAGTVKDKAKGEKWYQSYMSTDLDDFAYDNQNFILEILESTDLEKDLKNPFAASAVCRIKEENKKNIDKKETIDLVTNIGLGVAPFFLGPIGMMTRLATAGRLMNYGIKGAAIIGEGAISAYDFQLASESTKKCQNMKIQLMAYRNNPRKSEDDLATLYEKSKSCQENAETEYLMAFLGTGLGAGSYLAGAASKGTKLGKIINNQVEKASLALNRKALQKTLNELDVPLESRNSFVKNFSDFLSTSGLTKKQAIKRYKKDYQDAQELLICKL